MTVKDNYIIRECKVNCVNITSSYVEAFNRSPNLMCSCDIFKPPYRIIHFLETYHL